MPSSATIDPSTIVGLRRRLRHGTATTGESLTAERCTRSGSSMNLVVNHASTPETARIAAPSARLALVPPV
jgi:hypothetical protein